MREDDFGPLRRRLREIADLEGAAAVLTWDQNVHLPVGGVAARGQQLATLARLTHDRWLESGFVRDLERAERSLADAPDAAGGALVGVVRREFERVARIPSSFTAARARHSATAFAAWVEAREGGRVRPALEALERTLEQSQAYAGFVPGHAHPADPLIDARDEGATVASLQPLFVRLRAALVPWVAAWSSAPAPEPLPAGPFGREAQLEAALDLAVAVGYDLRRGRQDVAPHPFSIRFARGDVRLTTRLRSDDLTEALFSTLHEAGHAMYEQGVAADLEGTPLASGASAGVHESQARLWENQVARGRAFWSFALPRLRRRFPAFERVDEEHAYRAVNRVAPGPIRTDADEVTYNLHVIVRFDLELELLEGRLAVADLPDAWADRYRSDLRVTPSSANEGWLQDIHWFGGLIGGGFQGYALGNVLSAQLYAAAARDLTDLEGRVAAGDFAPLRGWLGDRIHRHGRTKPVDALVGDATGSTLVVEPYLAYLRGKYEALTGVAVPAG
jgi:carboxypeptidase Taq